MRIEVERQPKGHPLIQAINQSVIARELGVSQRAVSFALNRKPGVSPETRRKILEAAQRMGYQPNAAARATRTRRFRQVALLNSVDKNVSYRPAPLLDAVHDALAERDLNTVYVKLPDEKLVSEGYTPRILRELMVDGLLVNYRHHIPPRMVELIEANHLPAVWLGAIREQDCVYPDDRDGARRLTEHLLGLGHRRIAFVDLRNGPVLTPETRPAAVERRAGYEMAMKRAGLAPALICGARPLRVWPQRVAEAMGSADRPTALICIDYAHAEQVFPVLERGLGLSTPGDVSVATFCFAPYRIGLTPVATMVTPHDACGRLAVEMLLKKIEDPARGCDPVRPGHTFTPGETLGPPPKI